MTKHPDPLAEFDAAADCYLAVAGELTTFGIPDPLPLTAADLAEWLTGAGQAFAEAYGLVWPPTCIDTALAEVSAVRRRFIGRLPR